MHARCAYRQGCHHMICLLLFYLVNAFSLYYVKCPFKIKIDKVAFEHGTWVNDYIHIKLWMTDAYYNSLNLWLIHIQHQWRMGKYITQAISMKLEEMCYKQSVLKIHHFAIMGFQGLKNYRKRDPQYCKHVTIWGIRSLLTSLLREHQSHNQILCPFL